MQRKFVDVILTDAANPLGRVVYDNLTANGLTVFCLDGPSAGKDIPGYFRTLKNTLKELDAGMIVPVFFPEVLSARRDEFSGIAIPVDSASKIELLDNKLSACELAAGLGVPQPRRYAGVDEVERFPVVFKRTKGQGGDSVYFPSSRKALQNLVNSAAEYLITDYIDGSNYCVDALRKDDYFRASVYRVLAPSGKGVSTKREAVDCPLLVEYSKRILDAVDYQGVCGLDFRVDNTNGVYSAINEAYFLECNPRFSGGLQTAIDNGFEIPYLLWVLYKGK